jgi:hypothetical protein
MAHSLSGLTIDVATMSDGDDLDTSSIVIDDVQDAVVSDPHPIRALPLELDDAGWPRSQAESGDPFDDPIVCAAWKDAQLALGRSLEQYLIRHYRGDRRARAAR